MWLYKQSVRFSGVSSSPGPRGHAPERPQGFLVSFTCSSSRKTEEAMQIWPWFGTGRRALSARTRSTGGASPDMGHRSGWGSTAKARLRGMHWGCGGGRPPHSAEIRPARGVYKTRQAASPQQPTKPLALYLFWGSTEPEPPCLACTPHDLWDYAAVTKLRMRVALALGPRACSEWLSAPFFCRLARNIAPPLAPVNPFCLAGLCARLGTGL
jgi:hypothetical protein